MTLLRIFLGIIFLSAGIYRIFNWPKAVIEFEALNLNSVYLIVLITGLEIVGGLLLLLNIKTKKVFLVFAVIMALAIINAFLAGGKNIILQSGELFAFDLTPTDVFLHTTYLIILIYLLTNKTSKLK